jgi:NAD(P)-dependent dehydrogenase (short-subunit alcohol dehydrogenase family)
LRAEPSAGLRELLDSQDRVEQAREALLEAGAKRVPAAGAVGPADDDAGSQRRAPEGVLALTEDDWESDVATNLLGPVRLDRALLPTMIAQSSGVIVHVGSGAARFPQPTALAYAAAKAGLATYSKGW